MALITFLVPSLARGGAQRTVLKVAGGLARGHRVDVVLFGPDIVYPKEVPGAARLIILCGRAQWERRIEVDMPAGADWRVERARPVHLAGLAAGLIRDFRAGSPILLRRAAFGRALRLVRYVERERPDILFANLAPAEYPAFFARRLARRLPGLRGFPPIVPVVRNIAKRGIRHTRRRRMLFPEAAHVVTVSRGVAENASAVLGVPAGRMTPIYNPTFTPDIARRANAVPSHPWFGDGGTPVILGAGRLTPQKDFPTLIAAFRHVADRRPSRLVILGEGPGRRELEDRIRALGLENSVSLPG